jgi:dinuclear metal center YbgI/SA1388 family protein
MSISQQALSEYLAHYLKISQIKDYAPNGLQVQGKRTIQKIVTGVTASQALIAEAIALNADAILVHHGYFWKNEPAVLVGMKYERIKALINHDINLYAYHLPLDIHPEVGNNQQLGKLLLLTETEAVVSCEPEGIIRRGRLPQPQTAEQFSAFVSQQLSRECLLLSADKSAQVNTVAWCTGGGQDYIEMAAALGVDVFISGEVSERTTHIAHELGIHYIAAGHHATERYGVKALGEHLAKTYALDVHFIDINNPV